ncbi:MAG: OmpA family protein [Desulfuromonadaceae bacterium]|nr:OmpA family protein [Desulfuromonadaceae bacterium]
MQQGKPLSIIMLVLLVPLTSHATDIRQRPYSYSFDAAVAKEDRQFVVCSNCPDNQLSKMPFVPKLAVRLSAPDKQTVPAALEEHEDQNKKVETKQESGRTETVRFNFDSAQLSRNERERLTGLMKELPTNGTFGLTGYTCSIGTTAYNEKLSLRRANQVADILKANGVNVGTVKGKGTCCPVSQDKRLNRRVEIMEQRKEEK